MAKNPTPKAAAAPVVEPQDVVEPSAVAEAPVASASEADVTEAEVIAEEIAQAPEAEAAQDQPEQAAAQEAAAQEGMVPVNVPRAFGLCLDVNHVIPYKAGAYLMKREHAEHWYTKASGVTIIE